MSYCKFSVSASRRVIYHFHAHSISVSWANLAQFQWTSYHAHPTLQKSEATAGCDSIAWKFQGSDVILPATPRGNVFQSHINGPCDYELHPISKSQAIKLLSNFVLTTFCFKICKHGAVRAENTQSVSKCGCVGVNLCASDLKKCGHNEAFQHAYKTVLTV